MKLVLLLVVLFTGFSSLLAASATKQPVLQQLSAQLAQMQTIAANYRQTTADEAGNVLQDVTGMLRIKRPQQFYQLASDPYQHLVVSDGTTMWLYDIDLEQATRKTFVADEGSIPALLLSGDIAQIGERYAVTRTETDQRSHYQLTAHSDEAIFVQLQVVFVAGLLQSLSFEDEFSQQTRLQFSDLVLNGAIDDALFQFSVPAGIDVIDETIAAAPADSSTVNAEDKAIDSTSENANDETRRP